jgi:hypothetical protein
MLVACRHLLSIDHWMKENPHNAEKEKVSILFQGPLNQWICSHWIFYPSGFTLWIVDPQENYCFICRSLQAVINYFLRTLSLEEEVVNALFLTLVIIGKMPWLNYAYIMGKWKLRNMNLIWRCFVPLKASLNRHSPYYISSISLS